MSTTILATKLFHPPPRPDVVVRERLVERLNAGLHGKLTLVSAPVGFGKTTLVAEWLASSPNPAAWLSLDEADNEPTRFLSYLVAAVREVVPDFAAGVWGALQSPQPPPTEALMTSLLNELSAAPDGLTVVLDDYHVIASEAVDRALAFLLEHLPPRMHLVVVTREDPRLPLARLRARGQLTELRASDLRFTSSEASEFLQATAGLVLSAEEVSQLETHTEGWVAGLQLAALSMRGHEDTSGFIASFTGSNRFVVDYLVEEVLQRQSERLQKFLVRTSILDRLCGPLCDAVLRDSSSSGQATLEAIDHANLFVVPLDDERRWYRYHHLFAELLRRRLQESAQSTAADESVDVAELHRRASLWFEEQGLRIEAFQHAAAAHDIARAERLVAGEGMPMHLRGAAAPVLGWLEGLPTDVLNGRPSLWLLYASALLFSGRNVDAVRKLEAAEAAVRGVEGDEENRNLLGRVASFRATIAVIHNDATTILSQARRALEHLDEVNLPDRMAATWAMGYAHRLQGDRAAARRAFSEVIDLGQSLGDSLYTIAATLTLGQLQEEEAQLSRASTSYARVVKLAGEPPQLMACEAHLGLARVAYERNDLNGAQEQAQRSLHLARQTQGVDTVASCGVLLARLRLALGDVPGADAALDEAEAFVHDHGFTARVPEITAERVRTLLCRGDVEAAATLAAAHELPAARARVQLAQGDAPAALAVVDAWSASAEASGGADEALRALVLRAVALHAGGDEEEAIRTVGEGLERAEPGGLVRVFVDEGAPMAHLVHEAEVRGMRPGHAAKVLAAFAMAHPKGTAAGAVATTPEYGLREPLSGRELEILRLLAQGLSNREIAERLFRALDTVKGHLRRIYDKLEVRNRTEAVARARELGLL